MTKYHKMILSVLARMISAVKGCLNASTWFILSSPMSEFLKFTVTQGTQIQTVIHGSGVR